MNTDKPLPPPFPVGATVRYLGKRHAWKVLKDGSEAPIIKHGIIVPIIKVNEGRQGTGQFVMEDDDGHEIYDETQNGYSLYDAGKGGHWIIWPEDVGDWEVVKPPCPDCNGEGQVYPDGLEFPRDCKTCGGTGEATGEVS